MVLVADYGSVEAPAASRAERKSNRNVIIAVTALLALGLVALTAVATQDYDDGSVTLAEFQKQQMNEYLIPSSAQRSAKSKMMAAQGRTQSLATVNENTAGNPDGGVLENVPATVVGPVPGPPDFNGASAVVARLPNLGFAPSLLTEKGFETRGTFTVRKARAGESFYLRIYAKLNHNFRCTIRGYRDLSGDFTGNTIYTGFKKIYTGKSQIQTGHVPRGIVGEFDIMTCRDLGNGEVQYFRIRYD